MSDIASTSDDTAARRDALVERLFLATVGTMDVLAVYIGDRLGLYRILAERGPMTSVQLADRGGAERALRARVARTAGDECHPRGRRRER
jgi:hypothetical protein